MAKLDRNYYNALEQVRKLEKSVQGRSKEEYAQTLAYLKEDTSYSEEHSLRLSQEKVEIPTVDQRVDPHLLKTQKESTFKEDTEESSGSIEDYKKLKGQS